MGRNHKFDKELKIKICKLYLSGEESCNSLHIKYNTNPSLIRRWSNKYITYGDKAFDSSNRNNSYDKDFKLMVIKDVLDGVGSMDFIALKHNINQSLVHSWYSKYNKGIEIREYNPKGDIYTMANRKTTNEEKIEIINYVLNNNNDIKGAADKYLVKYATIYSWMTKYNKTGEMPLDDKRGRPSKKDEPEREYTELELLQIKCEKQQAMITRLERMNYALKKKEKIEERLMKSMIGKERK